MSEAATILDLPTSLEGWVQEVRDRIARCPVNTAHTTLKFERLTTTPFTAKKARVTIHLPASERDINAAALQIYEALK